MLGEQVRRKPANLFPQFVDGCHPWLLDLSNFNRGRFQSAKFSPLLLTHINAARKVQGAPSSTAVP
jgi:hypothetical protein